MLGIISGIGSTVLPMLGGFMENQHEQAAWEAEMRNRQLAIEQQEIQARQAGLQLAAQQFEAEQRAKQTRTLIFGGLGLAALIGGFLLFRPKAA